MKKMIMTVLVLLLSLPLALAEEALIHFESVSAFCMDYPADLFGLVSDDDNIIFRALDSNATAVVAVLCEDDLTADPAARLVGLAKEYGMKIAEADIERFPTKGMGSAYRLSQGGDDYLSDTYIVREDDRQFEAFVTIAAEDADDYAQAAHEMVLSIAVNPNMVYTGAPDFDEEEWETGFYDEMIDTYAPVLALYGRSVSEQWDVDKLLENDVSVLLALSDDPEELAEQIRFDFVDLDGTGTYSLLVFMNVPGEEDDIDVLGLYTKNKDGSFATDALGAERSTYALYGSRDEGYTLVNYASASAFQSGIFVYKKVDGRLQLIEAVIYDASAGENGGWYCAVDEDWNVTNDTPITEKEAYDITDKYEVGFESDACLTLEDFMLVDMGIIMDDDDE